VLLRGESGGTTGPLRIAYGISDQSYLTYADPHFRALGLGRARIVVSYDVAERGDTGFLDERSGRYTKGGDRNQPGELENLDRWMSAARAGGYEPLVSFQFSKSSPDHLPSLTEYRSAVRAFLDRYRPGWDAPSTGRRTGMAFTAWNEPNFPAQPTWGHPRQAARYHRVLRALCGGRCTVAAGDLAQIPAYEAGPLGKCGAPPGSRPCDGTRHPADGRRLGQREYLRAYRAELRADPPQIWAYHPYGDTNMALGGRRGTAGVRAFARDAIDAPPRRFERARIWLTEAGGILENSPGSKLELDDERTDLSPRGPAPVTGEEREQVAEVRHLLDRVTRADPRIERLYYYSFRVRGLPSPDGCRNFSAFDSGLVRECAPAGHDRRSEHATHGTVRRPAYAVFHRALRAAGRTHGAP
jgi:hypothetical protein